MMFLAQECSKQSSFEIFENVDILVSFGDKIENRGLGGVYRVGEKKQLFFLYFKLGTFMRVLKVLDQSDK